MSWFRSLMDDFDDDYADVHRRSMSHMYNMLMPMPTNPFAIMGQNAFTDVNPRSRGYPNSLQTMLFSSGFPAMPNMNAFFTNFDNLVPNGDSHSFCTRSVTTMSSGPDGRPQVYQETMSTTTAPGGIKETQKTVCDSRTGTKKMAIGHHIGEKAHILEREQNVHSGEQEERQEFINIDEDEAESFNHEWQTRSRRAGGAIGRGAITHLHAIEGPESSRQSSSSRWAPSSRRSIKPSTSSTYSALPAPRYSRKY